MVAAIAAALSAADPDNNGLYRANAASLATRLDALRRAIEHDLAPVKGVHFVVFHAAFPYLHRRLGLHTVGSIPFHPQPPPGRQRLTHTPTPTTPPSHHSPPAAPPFH